MGKLVFDDNGGSRAAAPKQAPAQSAPTHARKQAGTQPSNGRRDHAAPQQRQSRGTAPGGKGQKRKPEEDTEFYKRALKRMEMGPIGDEDQDLSDSEADEGHYGHPQPQQQQPRQQQQPQQPQPQQATDRQLSHSKAGPHSLAPSSSQEPGGNKKQPAGKAVTITAASTKQLLRPIVRQQESEDEMLSDLEKSEDLSDEDHAGRSDQSDDEDEEEEDQGPSEEGVDGEGEGGASEDEDGSGLSGSEDGEGGTSEEEEDDDDDEDGAMKQLSELPLETRLALLQDGSGPQGQVARAAAQAARLQEAGFKRLNRHRPQEMSSKRPVSRFREIVEPTRKVSKDPRFVRLQSDKDKESAAKRYAFLYDEVLAKEKGELRGRIKAERKPGVKAALSAQLQRVEQTLTKEAQRRTRAQVEAKVKVQQRGAIAAGKTPYFLKAADRKKLELVAKYEALKSGGKLERFMEKRRKHNASKDHRYLPMGRRGEDDQ